MQPRCAWIGRGTDEPAVVVRILRRRTGRKVFTGRIVDASVDTAFRREVELRRVSIVSVEIRGTLDILLLRFGEGAEEAAGVCLDGFRVVAGEIDGVREPALVEVPGTLNGSGVFGGVCEWDLVSVGKTWLGQLLFWI